MNAAVAKSYWRSIRRGARSFAEVPPELKEAVRDLARLAAEAGEVPGEDLTDVLGTAEGEEAGT